jgi:hypothetical protein
MIKRFFLTIGILLFTIVLLGKEKVLKVKVACVYQAITDSKVVEKVTKGKIRRDIEDLIKIFKETDTDFVFRAFWRWSPCPESPKEAPDQRYTIRGYTYQHLKEAVGRIKEKMPGIVICGAIPAQKIEVRERDPLTGEILNNTYKMALDPAKWGLNLSKEEFQCEFAKTHLWVPKDLDCNLYDSTQVPAYFPDITNPNFQKLLLSWAKKQIDCGLDGIWIDMLYRQAGYLFRLTNDFQHPAVKKSYDAAAKIVDEIHRYGYLKGRYIYVGSWAAPIYFPYPAPNLDFLTLSPTSREILNKRLDENRWKRYIKKIREKFGSIPIFAFIDWASTTKTPLGAFSQKLSKEEQRELLEYMDEFFKKLGIVFVYPVHGGWMGNDATMLSFGKWRSYDSLAPEFKTYETIKKLTRN